MLGTLIVSCPDRPGLVAALAQFLTAHGANILHAEQHRDTTSGLFFQRMQFEMARMDPDRTRLNRELGELARQYEMTWRLHASGDFTRVAIFVSKMDHCLYDLILRQKEGELRCEIPLVVSNHPDLQRVAEYFGIEFRCIPVPEGNHAAVEPQQFELLQSRNIGLVVLARYMQILSPQFVRKYSERIINIHHSFLPAFAGGRPYHQAMERGVKLIGATSHYVTEQLDEGPIIEQDVVRVSHREEIKDLVARGRDVEKTVLARAVKAHLEHRVVVCGRKTIVFS
ncbi:MAG TPA: formyltetrahydrofolate deformylase [Planctomycetota bacterium]|nr:formyltetrahydrofolate deformylase [Planctomycetota bacterium]